MFKFHYCPVKIEQIPLSPKARRNDKFLRGFALGRGVGLQQSCKPTPLPKATSIAMPCHSERNKVKRRIFS